MIVFFGTHAQAVHYARQKGLNPQKDIRLASAGLRAVQGVREPIEMVFCSAHHVHGAALREELALIRYIDQNNAMLGTQTKESTS